MNPPHPEEGRGDGGVRFFGLPLLGLFLLTTPAFAAPVEQTTERGKPGAPGYVVARFRLDAREVALSGSLRLTLSFEGPRPLRVDLPSPLLAKASVAAWRVRPIGSARTEDRPDNRQRWEQSFRIDPYRPGDGVPFALAPLAVRAGTAPEPVSVSWDPVSVHVTSQIAKPDPSELRPPTGVEEVPPPAPQPAPSAAGPLLVLLVAAGLLAWLLVGRFRARRPARPQRGSDWALAAIGRIEQQAGRGELPGERYAVELDHVLRTYLEGRFGVPALRRTTAEVLAALTEDGRLPPPQADELRSILELCDLGKFADAFRDHFTADAGRLVAGRIRQFVRQTTTPPGAV